MTERSTHAPFQHRGVRAVREHVRVVIALEQKRFAFAEEAPEPFGNVSEVGDEADAGDLRFESERDLRHVVRNRSRVDRDVTDDETPADGERLGSRLGSRRIDGIVASLARTGQPGRVA